MWARQGRCWTRCWRLQRQIELLQPRISVAMGRFAAQALLGSSEPLGRLRGRVHERQGIPVIVTYHPAYLLRSPQDKALAWDDLCLAMEAYERSLPQSAEAASISSSPA